MKGEEWCWVRGKKGGLTLSLSLFNIVFIAVCVPLFALFCCVSVCWVSFITFCFPLLLISCFLCVCLLLVYFCFLFLLLFACYILVIFVATWLVCLFLSTTDLLGDWPALRLCLSVFLSSFVLACLSACGYNSADRVTNIMRLNRHILWGIIQTYYQTMGLKGERSRSCKNVRLLAARFCDP